MLTIVRQRYRLATSTRNVLSMKDLTARPAFAFCIHMFGLRLVYGVMYEIVYCIWRFKDFPNRW